MDLADMLSIGLDDLRIGLDLRVGLDLGVGLDSTLIRVGIYQYGTYQYFEFIHIGSMIMQDRSSCSCQDQTSCYD